MIGEKKNFGFERSLGITVQEQTGFVDLCRPSIPSIRDVSPLIETV